MIYAKENIKRVIKANGTTSVEVAEKLGMTKQQFSMRLKNLNESITLAFLEDLSTILGTPISELLGEEPRVPDDVVITIGGKQVTYKPTINEQEEKK